MHRYSRVHRNAAASRRHDGVACHPRPILLGLSEGARIPSGLVIFFEDGTPSADIGIGVDIEVDIGMDIGIAETETETAGAEEPVALM